MYKRILEKIESYNKIIVIRHKNPDYDAYGSQIGLTLSLKNKYPNKTILMDGDQNSNNILNVEMDQVTLKDYKESLVILVDQSSLNMLADDHILYAKDSIILDHHLTNPDFASITLINPDVSSASEIIADFLIKSNIEITKEAAEALFMGIVGDSFRFYYKGTTDKTFDIASALYKTGADIFEIYKKMRAEESVDFRRFKGYIMFNMVVEDKVAYIYVSKELRQKYHVDVFDSARGTVNLLGGIIGCEAFINFTEADDDTIVTEIRSKDISVVDVAKQFNGGGHALACGCTLKNKEDVNKLIDLVKKQVGGK